MKQDEVLRLAEMLHRAGGDAPSRPDCPSAEQIWSAVRMELPKDERLAVVDHTIGCPACAEAWRLAMTLGDRASFDSPRTSPARWRQAITWNRAAAACLCLALAGAAYMVASSRSPADGRKDGTASDKSAPTTAASSADRDRQQVQPRTQTPAEKATELAARQEFERMTPQARATLHDAGGRVMLSRDGRLTTPGPLSAAEAALVSSALSTRQVAVSPQVAALRTAPAPLMGPAAPRMGPAGRAVAANSTNETRRRTFSLIRPSGTMVQTDRPTLVWSPLEGASDYEVTIADLQASYREVAASGPVRQTSWTVPAPLPRGRTYSWQVVARTPTGEVKAPAPREGEVRFGVLSRARSDALAKLVAERPQHHLLLGLAYADAGVLDAAESELVQLSAANPASDVAPALLQSLRRQRMQR